MIRARSLVAAFVVLALLGILLRDDPRQFGATSFGYVPSGHRGLYELFVALGWPVVRSYGPADLLPPGSSVWWIEPRGLCAAPDEDGPGAPAASDSALVAFVEGGGTALVALSARRTLFSADGPAPCPGLGGVALPPRDLPASPEEATASESEGAAEEPEEAFLDAEEALVQEVASGLGGGTRVLELPRLATFEAEGHWRARARLGGRPFVLERERGAGRLVVLADATFLRNRWLDAGDAAPLTLDLARSYGLDRIDERSHGLRFDEPGTLAFLAASPALPLFAGLALLGALVFWRGSARPAPLPPTPSARAPTLEGFVASLAALYGRSRDHARLAERYRELSLARLRRHFGLPSDIPQASVLERLRGQDRLSEAELAELAAPAQARSPAELRRRIGRFDAIVEEGSR